MIVGVLLAGALPLPGRADEPQAPAGLDQPAARAALPDEATEATPAQGETAGDDAARGAEPVAAPARGGAASRRAGASSVEEVLVTGRRREEAIQSTPLSIVALSSESLETLGLENVQDIGQNVANLKFDTTTGSNTNARIYIRGVGQDEASSRVDPGVGVYIDGVYLPRSTGSLLGLVDIERIEVLRGPQGTLYGKNTVGGVISVITKKPGNEFGGEAQLSAGSFGAIGSKLALDVPIRGALSERVFTRFSLATRSDDGYLENQLDDGKAGDDKLLAGRFQLRALPTDKTELLLSYDRTREYERVPVGKCQFRTGLALSSFTSNNFTRLEDDCKESQGKDEFDVFASKTMRNEQDIQGATGTLSWDATSDLTLRSISSWRRIDQRRTSGDIDTVRGNALGLDPGKDQFDTITQELLATGRALDDRVSYSAGAYFFKEKGNERNISDLQRFLLGNPDFPVAVAPSTVPDPDPRNFGLSQDQIFRAFSSFLTGEPDIDIQFVDALGGLNAIIDQETAKNPNLSRAAATNLAAAMLRAGQRPEDPSFLFTSEVVAAANGLSNIRFETLSYAGFSELTYDVTDRVSLTAGARYTTERRERQTRRVPLFPQFLPAGFRQTQTSKAFSERFDKWTSRLQGSFQITDDILAYAQFSRGFKSGGFNVGAGVFSSTTSNLNESGAAINNNGGKFDPEVLDSYEIGLKTSFFDRKLTVNLTGFYNKYDEIQLSILRVGDSGFPSSVIENAGKATVKGLEADFQIAPLPGLFLTGGFGFTDAEYDDFRTDFPRPFDASICPSVRLDQCGLRLDGATLAEDSPLFQVIGALASPQIDRDVDVTDLDFKQTPSFNYNVQLAYFLPLQALGLDWGTIGASVSFYQQNKTFLNVFNTVEQPKFGLLNARIGWELWDGRTSIAVSARNLLDRRYIGGALDLGQITGTNSVFFAPPRQFTVEVRRSFGAGK